MQSDSMFRIASISTSITAVAALKFRRNRKTEVD
ncbi:MAG: beta-lactamase family protein [Candidatus Obscuribacterales bacterium]|nr:beta-lactamase family protein [Candidatus Obscuribacterales bacterium]